MIKDMCMFFTLIYFNVKFEPYVTSGISIYNRTNLIRSL